DQFFSEVYSYAKKLDSIIKLNSPQSKVVFYMTWGYRYGDALNCPSFPPFCTYWSMSERLYQNYSLMARDFGSVVSPVGAAWRESISKDSTIVLHGSDNSHPSINGTYLSSCVFYSTFFHDSVSSQEVPSGMNASDCLFLQNISNIIIFDSLAYWLQNQSICDNPTDLSSEINFATSDSLSAICNFTWNGTSPSYDLRYKKVEEDNWYRMVVNQNSVLINLSIGNWQWRVKGLCSDSCQSFWVDTNFSFTASLNEANQNTSLFNVYYSKEEGKINIDIVNIFEDLDIEIIDLKGQTLTRLSGKPESGEYRKEIDISSLNNGLYIVKIKSISSLKSFKILKT
ncbi:MAG: T9SS type A sorting domain-containing protein, partial [Bacteroidales bacterium]